MAMRFRRDEKVVYVKAPVESRRRETGHPVKKSNVVVVAPPKIRDFIQSNWGTPRGALIFYMIGVAISWVAVFW